jgi:hypothetical protein
VTKGNNIVPFLSEERFVITVVFLQDSKTYLMELLTKLEGKYKLQLWSFP